MQKKQLFKLSLIFLVFFNFSCKAQNKDLVAKGAQLKLVAEDYEFTEGPAVDQNGDVYFTDQPNDRILKWDASNNSVSEYLSPAGRSNGLFFDNDGNLLSCADEKNELWRIDSKKNITVLISDFEGKKLNGPNDLWVDAKGGIYFTDPFYARPWWTHTEPELEAKRVYYRSPDTHQVRIVAEDFIQPNGIVGSDDGKILYVADIGAKKTYSFTMNGDGGLSDRKLFVPMGSDGMTLDNQGNVYVTGDGVTIFDRSGEQLLHIPVPENWTANVIFGGPDQNILFITAMDSVYTLAMNVNGIR